MSSRLCVTVALVCLFTGCNKDLTRYRAKSILLESSPLFKDPVVSLQWRANGYQEWARRGGDDMLLRRDNLFAHMDAGLSSSMQSQVEFFAPEQRTITEVTDIVDVPLIPNVKGVEFCWSLVGLPTSGLPRLLVTEGTGTAFFTKYDDGWRVDNSMTKLTPDYRDLPITPEQQKEIDKDIAIEAKRIASHK